MEGEVFSSTSPHPKCLVDSPRASPRPPRTRLGSIVKIKPRRSLQIDSGPLWKDLETVAHLSTSVREYERCTFRTYVGDRTGCVLWATKFIDKRDCSTIRRIFSLSAVFFPMYTGLLQLENAQPLFHLQHSIEQTTGPNLIQFCMQPSFIILFGLTRQFFDIRSGGHDMGYP